MTVQAGPRQGGSKATWGPAEIRVDKQVVQVRFYNPEDTHIPKGDGYNFKAGSDEVPDPVYAGKFKVGVSGDGKRLISVSPWEGSHFLKLKGFFAQEGQPPMHELKPRTWMGEQKGMKDVFRVTFTLADEDTYPGLEVVWGSVPYIFVTVQYEGQQVMTVSMAGNRIGRDETMLRLLLAQANLASPMGWEGPIVEGPKDNYLPDVEPMLVEALEGTTFIGQFDGGWPKGLSVMPSKPKRVAAKVKPKAKRK